MKLFPGLEEMLFPPRCLGCLTLHRGLCKSCVKDWRIGDYRSRVSQVPILSSIQYSRTASRILLASKEDGIAEADDFVIRAMANSLENTREILGDVPPLVPIPSSSQANRRRGRNYIAQLTKILSQSQGIQMRDVLFHQRKVVDQSTLAGTARTENLMGAMSTRETSLFFRPVVLVDDLVTTGSTLSEGIRALERAGYTVVAGITAFLAQPLR